MVSAWWERLILCILCAHHGPWHRKRYLTAVTTRCTGVALPVHVTHTFSVMPHLGVQWQDGVAQIGKGPLLQVIPQRRDGGPSWQEHQDGATLLLLCLHEQRISQDAYAQAS